MKNIFLSFIIAITFLSIISATEINISSGDSYTFDVGTTTALLWDVVGNSSDLTGLNITQDGTNITLTFDERFASDNFTLIFFKPITNEIVREVSSGGGGGGSCSGGGVRTIYKNVTQNGTIQLVEGNCEEEESTTQVPVVKETKSIFKQWWFWVILVMVALIISVTLIICYYYFLKGGGLNNE